MHRTGIATKLKGAGYRTHQVGKWDGKRKSHMRPHDVHTHARARSLSLCLSVSVSLSLSVSVSGALWLEFDPLGCAPFRVPLLYNGRRKVLSVMLSL